MVAKKKTEETDQTQELPQVDVAQVAEHLRNLYLTTFYGELKGIYIVPFVDLVARERMAWIAVAKQVSGVK